MHLWRHTRALATKQQDVARVEREIKMRLIRVAAEQHDPRARRRHIGAKRLETGMAVDCHMLQIVKPGAAQGALRHVETCRGYQAHSDIHACGKTQNCASVLRNIRLIERELQFLPFRTFSSSTPLVEVGETFLRVWLMRYFVTDFNLDSLILENI